MTREKLRDSHLGGDVDFRGDWWLPDQPKDVVPGRLWFDANGWARLELDGEFSAVCGDDAVATLHGASETAERVTLGRLQSAGSSLRIPGTRKVSYFVKDIFVGDHIEDTVNASFGRSSVTLDRLDEWLRWHPLDHSGDFDSATISFTRPTEESIQIDAIDAQLLVTSRHRVQTGARNKRLSFEPVLELRPPNSAAARVAQKRPRRSSEAHLLGLESRPRTATL